MGSKVTLGAELFSPPEAVYLWHQSEIAPFKYRYLFSAIVKSTYEFIVKSPSNRTFHITYIIWSALTYIGAVISFFYLMLTVKFSPRVSFWGIVIFLVSPAIIYAYTLPVHTKEDFLGYSILCLGLSGIIKRKTHVIILCTVLGVLCRETLMLIPFTYLFFSNDNIYKRLSVAALGFLTLISVRILLGLEKYDALAQGFYYNIDNLVESLGFIYLVFNILWLPFLYSLFVGKTKDSEITLFNKSGVWVLLLVLGTTLFGGRFNEIRLMFILFPWIYIVCINFYLKHKIIIWDTFKAQSFYIYGGITAIVFIAATVIAIDKSSDLFPPSPHQVPYDQWIFITFFYLWITFLTVPALIQVVRISSKAKVKGNGA